MLHPTIDELTRGQYNRYELALATAKCARLITDEYVRQHDVAEKSNTGNKETDRPLNTMIDKELRDEKAVHVAVNRLKDGVYVIDVHANDPQQERRLRGRGTESDEVVKGRLARTYEEMEYLSRYDYVVYNEDIDACADDILSIIHAEKCAMRRHPDAKERYFGQ